ncbi:MAG: hypothetical protein COV59_00230 [Candidatus Magasanikbacteria bacterium CG11_big_fil_rev_8_21_14_0_20_39_34]|uniref:DUF2065 domain-containing protein n=1 Tax=Candidatus Magasanikbacteria bacterium CG11_big_fil_rev_8_21_14_0_20_39_34 TaxID=1974653 RepID=A0A2H0N6K9_9BACT|nr:MAG: hypothetical protein COV59_00230 [Candidatus Magasanikbacteria bacterium CG11_big_fil_rev_8_21_14_0_20_39_34]
MTNSIFLAQLFGLFFLVIGLALLINKNEYKTIVGSVVSDPSHVFLWGIPVFALGSLLVLSHSQWTGGWEDLITLLGWAAFLKGVLLLLFPGLVYEAIKKAHKESMFLLEFSFSIILGIVLVYFGFMM